MKKKLLLLHGAIGAKDQLQPLKRELENDFEVHTLSFSGHGGEEMPSHFSIPVFASDVINYLEKNGIARICIFGYSMGGYVALYLAKHHPEKVEQVFTLATKFEWTPQISQKETKMLDPAKIEEKIPAFASSLAKRHQPNDWRLVLKKTAEMMVGLGEKNALTLSDLQDIKISTKICVGDKDNMVTLEETKQVAQNLRNSGLLILQDTLHPIEKTDVKLLSEEIKTFFR